MEARNAVANLLRTEREWRCFFKACCETNTCRLTSQAWRFRDELGDRGHRFPSEEVEDTLFGLARDLLLESAAAKWDAEWAHELCKDALASLAEYYARLSAEEKDIVDLSVQDAWDERMTTAGLGNDLAAFRAALKRWEQAGLEALKRAQAR